MAQKSGELKKRCQLAKQRLKMGYWQDIGSNGTAEFGAPSAAARSDGARMRLRIEYDNSASAHDEKMYEKVCAILDCDEIALNPIGQLIDNQVYGALDSAGKQRYILELSNKFRELKERYYRERTGA